MVLTLKQATVVTLTVATVCFLSGRYSSPSKVQIKEVEKVVYKEVKRVKKDVVKTIKKKETTLKDGTVIRESETVKRDASTIDSSKEIQNETTKIKVVETRPNWHLNVNLVPTMLNLKPTGSVSLQYRLFGEVYLGAFVDTNKAFGVSIGIGF